MQKDSMIGGWREDWRAKDTMQLYTDYNISVGTAGGIRVFPKMLFHPGGIVE